MAVVTGGNRKEEEKLEMTKCRNCGREFTARTNQRYCNMSECRKASVKAANDKYRGIREAEQRKEHTVDNTCPKDCRFRDVFAGPVHYCNFGDVALREGLADKPARGGSVKDCWVYEPGKKKRRTVKIAATCPERRAENEVYAYKQDCIGQRKGGSR